MAVVNIFASITIAGTCFLTASMYAITVKAAWAAGLADDMPDFTMEQAASRVSDTVLALGNSALGLAVILLSGLMTTAFNLGGLPWLLTHVSYYARHMRTSDLTAAGVCSWLRWNGFSR
jgi:hypothetical protein